MRVILDSNVWSYVGIDGCKAELESLARSRRLSVRTPPATLLEVLRTKDAEKRDRIIDAMTSRHWVRLRTEADMECEEFVAEARRLRPQWVRQLPRPGRPAALRDFWTRQIWREAARDSAPLAARQPDLTGEVEDHVFGILKDNSLAMRHSDWRGEDLAKVTYVATEEAPDSYLAGWRHRSPAPGWRVEGRDVFRHALDRHDLKTWAGRDTTYGDWLAPYLYLDRVMRDLEDFTRFWLTDIIEARMPRNWLRWVSGVALLEHKVTKSTGRDNQLACYLPDCDVFLSEDRRFVRALQRVKETAPIALPEIRCVDIEASGGGAVDVIAAALD
ncbi:hypothetical protein RM572_15735 [Streptomyces sp. DSM 42041]|uniref:DUF4935 domain-containing protein n=1 Tax=Streptomyces hazeniae TaxID=3075538 RepID=A0ABU2NTA3_9ACTN|nr:hypothetical protein [Streptomyces sp. DSM 42041]MDT0380210.1 hypothetical protein [Streptomyces sp. DSM 42041]